ncbi:hypothetical protein [Methanosphaera sp.]
MNPKSATIIGITAIIVVLIICTTIYTINTNTQETNNNTTLNTTTNNTNNTTNTTNNSTKKTSTTKSNSKSSTYRPAVDSDGITREVADQMGYRYTTAHGGHYIGTNDHWDEAAQCYHD